jgi:hypothetical protein
MGRMAEAGAELGATGGGGRSSFAATCARRLRLGNIATALGIVVLVGVSVRLDAVWVVVVPAIALAALFEVAVAVARRSVAQDARSVPVETLQPFVDELARRAGVAPPWLRVDDDWSTLGCSSSARLRLLIAPPEAVDAVAHGEPDEREEMLAVLAHQIGHLRRPMPRFVMLGFRGLPVFVACAALLTFSLRSWALLTAASYLFVCLPARWTVRWGERNADETARELGHGEAWATYLEAARSPSRSFPGLALHPPNRERARRLRR